MRTQWTARARRLAAKAAVGASLVSLTGMMVAPPAHASLLGTVTGTLTGTVGTVTGTVNGLVGVVTAGWDDGVTAPATPMSAVAAAIGADQLRSRGFDGSGIG